MYQRIAYPVAIAVFAWPFVIVGLMVASTLLFGLGPFIFAYSIAEQVTEHFTLADRLIDALVFVLSAIAFVVIGVGGMVFFDAFFPEAADHLLYTAVGEVGILVALAYILGGN